MLCLTLCNLWAIWLGAPHTCGRCTGPSQEIVLQHRASCQSCRSCPPLYWSAGDKMGPFHQFMSCALWCTYRCPAAPFHDLSGILWWQRPVHEIGSSHHQLFTWCALVDLTGTALHCHALFWVLHFSCVLIHITAYTGHHPVGEIGILDPLVLPLLGHLMWCSLCWWC